MGGIFLNSISKHLTNTLIAIIHVMALSHSDALHQRMPTYVNFHQHGGVR